MSGEIGVLLMSYGQAQGPGDVARYLASTRGGRPAPDELVAEFRRRYDVVGGSPLTRITAQQAAALEQALGEGACVEVGMRHAPPFIAEGLRALAARGARRVVAIVMSPQYSPIIMGGYLRAVEDARGQLPGVDVRVAAAWHQEPAFLSALAERVREAQARLAAATRDEVPVIFTAHSLPRSVVEREPGYIGQLQETAAAVAARVGLAAERWQWAYQSAGHTPEEWLRPDIKELFPALRAAGHRDVLIVPVQFLADHLEVLYDLDVAARAEAEAEGLRYRRIEMFNAMPAFIQALAAVVRRELQPVG